MTASLAEQAEAFADRLTATIRTVVGEDCPAFAVAVLEEASAFRVRQADASGIILSNDGGEPILRMTVDYKCVYDGHDQYLAIEESQIRVFVEPNGREPLFRYEFVRAASGAVPSAHIQFHGTHPELEQAMKDSGSSTSRAKARKQGQKPVRLDALHFPVGGSRFRPALEDVLQMLIEEFGVKPAGSIRAARTALAKSREQWRRMQVATVVRDAPAAAVSALEALGYKVTAPNPPAQEKVEKLRAY